MNIKSAIGSVSRFFLYLLMAVALLCLGLFGLLYSSWAQDLARVAVLNKLNTPPTDTHYSLDRLSLHFPLTLSLEGLAVTQNSDTLIAAGSLDASLSITPFLIGQAHIKEALLTDARYTMGGPDSAMSLLIVADSLALAPAKVHLSDMAIELSEAFIGGGRLNLTLNPDTSAPTPPAPPTQMSVKVDTLHFDRFTYTMRMMPTIDTLSAYIPRGKANDINVDLFTQNISVKNFSGSGLDARYIVPDTAAIAQAGPYPEPAVLPDSLIAPPWTVKIKLIDFEKSQALYTTAGLQPLPGLDFGYIMADSLNLVIRDFYNRATTVHVPLDLSARERCGVYLSANGILDIDSTAMHFRDFAVSTPEGTELWAYGMMGIGDLTTDPTLPVALDVTADLAPSDLGAMFPAFSPYFKAVPSAEDIHVRADIIGTMGHLALDTLELKLNRCITLGAEGNIENAMDPDALGGDIALHGNIINVNSFKKLMLDPATAKTLEIPPMTLGGRISMHRGVANGRLTARTKGGKIKLDGRWNSRSEGYKASLVTDQFPVNAFMPLLGVGPVTASLNVDGQGYNPFKETTKIDADLSVSSAFYEGADYKNIFGKAQVADGHAEVSLRSEEDALDFEVHAEGNLTGDTYSWTANVEGRNIDLQQLKFSTEPTALEIYAHADATIGPAPADMEARLVIDDLFYRQHNGTIGLSGVDTHFRANDSLCNVTVTNRTFAATFSAPCSLDSLTAGFSRAGEIMSAQMTDFMIDFDTLSRSLPPFALDIVSGNQGLINDILAPYDMRLRSMHFNANNDSALAFNGNIQGFYTGDMRLDSLYINGHQHGPQLHFAAGMKNRPGNLDQWHDVRLEGRGEGNQLQLRALQHNAQGKTGYDLGFMATAEAADSTIVLNVKPYSPTIGYQPWTVNDDNFISYHFPDKHIDANLHMSGGSSALAIYTEHMADSTDHSQEDLVINLTDIHIADWIALNPFAPPMKGDVSADLRLNRKGDMLVGKGSAGITNFKYGRDPVADFKANFDIAATPSGTIRANADLMVNGVRTITVSGALNDTTANSPLALDFSMIHFPLATVNPFLPAGMAKLSGMLNGRMDIGGTSDKPIFNGYIDFDSTAVKAAITGVAYKFSDDSIPVRDNVVELQNFEIWGCNNNPLAVSGKVDLTDMNNAKLNLTMNARNMQIVNSKKASKGADVYGKAYIDLDAAIIGSMKLLNIDAALTVLPETNVTYVVPDLTSGLIDRSNTDMVKFVNFTDSMAVVRADSLVNTGMAMFLDARLNIDNGSIINVDLSTDGKNKVNLQTNGSLDYTMTPLSTGRVVGRINIDGGFVRYSQPPIISEKLFNFSSGSYVAFNGDMMNPTLNVRAVDVLKANVTQSGQNSRLVNFDVSVGVTGTLNQMNVAFDLSTNDDMTVANELESMTPDQRANQAMNMLLYNIYTGPGTKANASLSGNPLFSFLESQVNSWAANAIKGVDISFGIDQYDRTVDGTTSSTMRYSYQVSKSLFNDRIKIVVGGNYSSDANTDENFSQNLINDISFEYFLNKTRTMYVRIFRHTGYESILEGEITKTGVGFVYTRKLKRIGDMFLPPAMVRKREKARAEADQLTQTANEQ